MRKDQGRPTEASQQIAVQLQCNTAQHLSSAAQHSATPIQHKYKTKPLHYSAAQFADYVLYGRSL